MQTTQDIKINDEFLIHGVSYWVEAEVTVHGVLEEFHEARECWGSNVYEIVYEWTPESAVIDFISSEVWNEDKQDHVPCETPESLKPMIIKEAMETEYNG